MFDFLKKKPANPPDPEDGVRVIRRADPAECGGTDATVDDRAPKRIDSDEMTVLFATSRMPSPSDENPGEGLDFVSAFASPAKGGTFLFLETADDFRYGEHRLAWALVREPLMPALARRVWEWDLAQYNGRHSHTHGLPENFGGMVDIRYAGGERIAFSDNQTPILSRRVGGEMAAFFAAAMAGETVALPALDSLREIRFSQTHSEGGYTRATMTLLPDGTARNRRQTQFGEGTPYESEKPVDADTVAAIKRTIDKNGLLGWAGLPHNGYALSEEKQLTFVFDDGRQITAQGDRLLPFQIQSGFFNVELEMTVKN